MCGITGFLDRVPGRTTDECGRIVRAMSDCLRKRGPDAGGAWIDAAAGIALGHRRLSILDLSVEGSQPMFSADGRFVLTFNGEIYNFADIRQELESIGAAPPWRGHSDTEIVLAAFSRWGVRDSVRRFVGMFAFGLWDRENRELWLARDRLGEKPLYYGRAGSTLLFGSELKALRAHPAWNGRAIDRGALALFMRYGYVPSPYSIYEGIFKLPAASLLRVCASEAARNGGAELVPETYWDLGQIAAAGVREPFRGSEAEAAEALEALLRRSVRGQMVADVPLGAFLSGGIDSSTVVALMQAESTGSVRTFTVGFREQDFNEAQHAKAIAEYLGTEHTELYVTAQEALDVIPKLSEIYDEPFADSSQVPTFLVAQMARKHVTVSLSGDGGDEVFGGYNRYFWARRIWRASRGLPVSSRRAFKRLLAGVSPGLWDSVFGAAGKVLGSRYRYGSAGDKVHKLAHIIEQKDAHAMYLRLVSQWESTGIVLDPAEHPTLLSDPQALSSLPDFTQRMMCLDALTYLPDDVLAKVDRAAMAVSLETRVPFLDHRVVEFAWTLPLSMKIRGSVGKSILRRVLYSHVPKELLERPKMGFGVPIAAWLRGPLRDWAASLLDERRVEQEGFLAAPALRTKWQEHQSGKRNWQGHLWNALMFQSWLEEQNSAAPVPAGRF